jgi:hypothetical protein
MILAVKIINIPAGINQLLFLDDPGKIIRKPENKANSAKPLHSWFILNRGSFEKEIFVKPVSVE